MSSNSRLCTHTHTHTLWDTPVFSGGVRWRACQILLSAFIIFKRPQVYHLHVLRCCTQVNDHHPLASTQLEHTQTHTSIRTFLYGHNVLEVKEQGWHNELVQRYFFFTAQSLHMSNSIIIHAANN